MNLLTETRIGSFYSSSVHLAALSTFDLGEKRSEAYPDME